MATYIYLIPIPVHIKRQNVFLENEKAMMIYIFTTRFGGQHYFTGADIAKLYQNLTLESAKAAGITKIECAFVRELN